MLKLCLATFSLHLLSVTTVQASQCDGSCSSSEDNFDFVQLRLGSEAETQFAEEASNDDENYDEASGEEVSNDFENYDEADFDIEDQQQEVNQPDDDADVRRRAREKSKSTPAPTEDTSTPKCHVILWLADNDPDGSNMVQSVEALMGNREAMATNRYTIFGGVDRFPGQRQKKKEVNGLEPAYGKTAVEFHEFSQYVEKYAFKGEVKLGISREGWEGDSFQDADVLKSYFKWAFQSCLRALQPSDKVPNPEIMITLSSRPAAAVDPDVEGSYTTANYQRHKVIHKAIIDGMKYQHPEIDKVTAIGFDGMLPMTVYNLALYTDVAEYIIGSETNHPTHGWDYRSYRVKKDMMTMARSIIDAFVAAPPQYTPKALTYVRTTHFSKFSTAWKQLGQVLLAQQTKNPLKSSTLIWARDNTPELSNSRPESVDVRSFLRNFKTACDAAARRPQSQQCNGRVLKCLDVTIAAYRSMMSRGYFRKNRNDLVESLSGVAFTFPTRFIKDRKMKYTDVFLWMNGRSNAGVAMDASSLYGWTGLVYGLLCSRPLIETVNEGQPGPSLGAEFDPSGTPIKSKIPAGGEVLLPPR